MQHQQTHEADLEALAISLRTQPFPIAIDALPGRVKDRVVHDDEGEPIHVIDILRDEQVDEVTSAEQLLTIVEEWLSGPHPTPELDEQGVHEHHDMHADPFDDAPDVSVAPMGAEAPLIEPGDILVDEDFESDPPSPSRPPEDS